MRPTFVFAGVICLIVTGAAWSQRTRDAHRLAATVTSHMFVLLLAK
jgi:hypothetical protein